MRKGGGGGGRVLGQTNQQKPEKNKQSCHRYIYDLLEGEKNQDKQSRRLNKINVIVIYD